MQFNFNYYHHWITLVVHVADGSGHLLQRKEGMTQGGPLAMISYGIGILPLICNICNPHGVHPHVTHPWYSDDTGTGGHFVALHYHMEDLLVHRLLQGYFPDTTKSILVVSPKNILWSED